MKNFIVRTITSVFFVAAIVSCFLRPEAMIFLFALVTGMTIWEFTGLVNDRNRVAVNQMISTVAGVYFFLAMAGFCSGITPPSIFVPYLVTLIYLMVAELYLKQEDPASLKIIISTSNALFAVACIHHRSDGIFCLG